MAAVDCPTACPKETGALKECMAAYHTATAAYNAGQDASLSTTAGPSGDAKSNQAPPSMVSCIPMIQAWKDCCEVAKYKAGQRVGDEWNQVPADAKKE